MNGARLLTISAVAMVMIMNLAHRAAAQGAYGMTPYFNRFAGALNPYGGAIASGQTPIAYLGRGHDAIIPYNEANEASLRAAQLAQFYALARANESIDAKIEKDGRLLVKWQGEPRVVSQIRFAILDKGRKLIKEQVITRLPAEARFTLTNKTAYYRVIVEYLNGATASFISPV